GRRCHPGRLTQLTSRSTGRIHREKIFHTAVPCSRDTSRGHGRSTAWFLTVRLIASGRVEPVHYTGGLVGYIWDGPWYLAGTHRPTVSARSGNDGCLFSGGRPLAGAE